jgi:hypothetical protein
MLTEGSRVRVLSLRRCFHPKFACPEPIPTILIMTIVVVLFMFLVQGTLLRGRLLRWRMLPGGAQITAGFIVSDQTVGSNRLTRATQQQDSNHVHSMRRCDTRHLSTCPGR